MTEGTETITTIHMLLMAVFAILVVIAIVAGMRKKRGRVKAQREVKAHAEEAGVADAPLTADPEVESPMETARDVGPAEKPVATAVAPDGTTVPTAADAQPADAGSSVAEGPLTQIKGLGPKVAARLGELGIDRVDQLAALDDARAAAIDADLGPFAGRMARDRWVEQARLLAAGDRDGFERVFGKL